LTTKTTNKTPKPTTIPTTITAITRQKIKKQHIRFYTPQTEYPFPNI
jgi:hypothetical protein